jgi:hypothetical protein
MLMEGVESLAARSAPDMDRLSTIHLFVLFAETMVRNIWFVETLPFQGGYGKELRISSLSQTRFRPYEMPFEE